MPRKRGYHAIITSPAVEIVLHRDSAKCLAEVVREADWVVAPTLFIAEVNNGFLKYQWSDWGQ